MNRLSAEVTAAAAGAGVMPIEYMLSVLRDPDADPAQKAWAAEKSAPFLHPRPSPSDRKVVLALADTSTTAGVDKALDQVIQAMANGEVTPGEGHSFISAIETRRKAIETGDLAERIRKLEESVGTTA